MTYPKNKLDRVIEAVADAVRLFNYFTNDPVADGDEYMGLRDAASYLGVSVDTVYDFCEEDELPHIKLGSVIRIKRSDLDQVEPEPRALTFHLAPDQWVVVWRDRPPLIKPFFKKRINDLQPGDRVTYGGRETTVLGVVVHN